MGPLGTSFLAPVLLGLTLQVGVPGRPLGPPSPLDSGEILEVDIRAPAGTRTRCFRLEVRDGPAGRTRIVGVSRWTVGRPPRSNLAGLTEPWAPLQPPLRIETQTTWFDADTLVVRVEESGPRGRSLIWREVGERTGRVLWLAEEDAGGFQSTEPVGRDLVRRRFGELDLTLHRIEEARRGAPVEACLTTFQPLEQRTEDLVAKSCAVGSGRLLELWRQDGSLAGRYSFEGEELVTYQLSEGGPVAVGIPPTEYHALLRSRRIDRSP